MKRILSVLLSLIIVFILNGCTQTKFQSISDELKSKDWEGNGKYLTTITLDFEDDNAVIEITSYGGAKNKISGLCLVSDNNFQITDEKLNETFDFSYKLEGDNLSLNYDGKTILMTSKE